MNTGTSRKRKFTFFLNRLKDKPKVKNKAQSMLKEVLIRTAILKIRQFSFGFTVLQGSELFVKLKSQEAQKTANLDLFVNLILQIEFAQFLE